MWCRKTLSTALVLASLLLVSPRAACGRQEDSGEVLVPKDAVLALELLSPLNTATNQKDDKFDCRVLSPVQYAGAVVSGHLRKVKNSGKGNGKSEIDLAFDRITFADGRVAGFNAQVKEVNDVAHASNDGVADPEGTVKGKSRVKISVKRAVLGGLAGAGIGALLGGAKGAAVGATIGAGLAVTTTLATEGPNLEFAAGTQFTVVTNAPSRRKESSAAAPVPSALASAMPAVPGPGGKSTLPGYKTYMGGTAYSLSVPADWQDFPSGGTVTLAPPAARIEYGGRPGFTHCVVVGVASAGGRDLSGASAALTEGFLRQNSYLRQQGDFVRGQVGGRDALAVTLSGTWAATGKTEHVIIYTAMMKDGSLFLFITDAPEADLESYRPLFLTILQSIQLYS